MSVLQWAQRVANPVTRQQQCIGGERVHDMDVCDSQTRSRTTDRTAAHSTAPHTRRARCASKIDIGFSIQFDREIRACHVAGGAGVVQDAHTCTSAGSQDLGNARYYMNWKAAWQGLRRDVARLGDAVEEVDEIQQVDADLVLEPRSNNRPTQTGASSVLLQKSVPNCLP